MTDRYQMCQVCVMDTTDPEIVFFDKDGCNHCIAMRSTLGLEWFMDESGESKLHETLEKIKREGAGQEFDSILGLSGGADSSYLALKAYDWGLRPLVVHIDGGWNSELAVRNIQSILDFTGWELQTNVINWPEMKDLQLSYLKSGVANQDVPQDHAFFSSLYSFATQNKIKYVLSGGNTSTEGIFPKSWHWAAMDSINLKAIHKNYGSRKLKLYPITSFLTYYFKYPLVKKMRPLRLLNFTPYVKEEALVELENRVGYKRYPRKHGESSFTRFFQGYFLPYRYGMDKRLPHFSSLIVSGQMTRDEAMRLLNDPLYSKGELERDIQFICRKLDISREEFQQILDLPLKNAAEFSNWKIIHSHLKRVQKLLEFISRRKIKIFS
jgi:N-acetyl sugar amidotransferase